MNTDKSFDEITDEDMSEAANIVDQFHRVLGITTVAHLLKMGSLEQTAYVHSTTQELVMFMSAGGETISVGKLAFEQDDNGQFVMVANSSNDPEVIAEYITHVSTEGFVQKTDDPT